MAELEPRNFLQPCLLLLLREQPDHGYDLAVRLRPMHDGEGDPGSVYRALRGLERQGLVRSEWNRSSAGPARRTYYITADGMAGLDDLADGLRTTRAAVQVFLERYARVVAADPRAGQEGNGHDRHLTATDVRTAFGRRDTPLAGLSTAAPDLARACHAMAGRFARGGRLLAFGDGLAAEDAAHVVVEFAHPVIVGKRALPAMRLADPATLPLFAEPDDIALAISPGGDDPRVAAALTAAAEAGLLTVALVGPTRAPDGVDHVVAVASDDARIVREAHVTAYHVLWELVHVFLEARVV